MQASISLSTDRRLKSAMSTTVEAFFAGLAIFSGCASFHVSGIAARFGGRLLGKPIIAWGKNRIQGTTVREIRRCPSQSGVLHGIHFLPHTTTHPTSPISPHPPPPQDPLQAEARAANDDDLAVLLQLRGLRDFLSHWYSQPMWGSLRIHPRYKAMLQRREASGSDPRTLAAALSGFSAGRAVSRLDVLEGMETQEVDLGFMFKADRYNVVTMSTTMSLDAQCFDRVWCLRSAWTTGQPV